MNITLPMVVLASQLAMPVADRAPALNVNPSCEAAAHSGITLKRDKQSCLNEEFSARDELNRQWTQYPAGDRGRCTQSTATGGVPSYVELLTCLEMAKLARDLPDDELKESTVGQGSQQ